MRDAPGLPGRPSFRLTPVTPTPEQQKALGELALRHGIELIGPPLAEEVAEAA